MIIKNDKLNSAVDGRGLNYRICARLVYVRGGVECKCACTVLLPPLIKKNSRDENGDLLAREGRLTVETLSLY